MISRRGLLKGLIVATVAPTGFLSGCKTERNEKAAPPPPRKVDFAADMTALLIAIGPWPPTDMETAHSFIERYLTSHAAPFQNGGKVLNALVVKLPSEGQQLAEIPLDVLSDEERTLLTAVVKDVYSIAEVHWYLVGIAAPGTCLGPA